MRTIKRTSNIVDSLTQPESQVQIQPNAGNVPENIPSAQNASLNQLFALTEKVGMLENNYKTLRETLEKENTELGEIKAISKSFKFWKNLLIGVVSLFIGLIVALVSIIWIFVKPEIIYLHDLAKDELAKVRIEEKQNN